MSKKNDSTINIPPMHNDILNLHPREVIHPMNRKLLMKSHKLAAAKVVDLDEIASVRAKVPWVSLVCSFSVERVYVISID